MENIKIFVVVVTYNGQEWIDKCVGSLRKSIIPVKPIVIDNCSQDETVRHIREKYPEVMLIENNENLGFGKANNIGLRLAKNENADYVFLLNQDAWVEDSTLLKAISVMNKYQEYGVLSPVHLNGMGSGLDFNFANYLCESCSNNLLSDLYLNKVKAKTPYEVHFVNAAAWLIRSSCIQKVGGFDPIFHHYGEDVDFINRVKYYNFKVGILPDSVIYHDRVVHEPAIQTEKKRRHSMNGLVLLKNINKNFIKCAIDFTGYCFKNIVKGVLQAELKLIKYGFRSLVLFGIKMPKILKHRRISRNTSAAFL